MVLVKMPDHPHACGENSPSTRSVPRSSGPSPRVWGEHPDGRIVRLARRTIPTRVGRTTRARPDAPLSPDHPHECGENGAANTGGCGKDGPSPRVWGELIWPALANSCNWTIPTRVGRTLRR